MDVSRWLDRAGFVGASGGIIASGAVQAVGVLTVRVEVLSLVLVVIVLQAVLSSIMVTAFVGLSGALFVGTSLVDGRSPARERDGGHVTAVVPVYRDAEALDRSVRSLLAASYDDLSVCIVCEPDDAASLRRAEALADHPAVEVLVNADPGTKAGAVNTAVERTASEYVAVFDADERVHPEFLAHAVAKLDACDVVQGRTIPEPTGPIEAVAYYESVLLSYVSRRVLYLLTDFRMASSRAVVMRRSTFADLGGYDPAMLTEDFAFAYRCYRERVAVAETLAYPSRIEAAHSLRDWWGQRKRWMTGYAQVVHRLVTTLDPLDYRSYLSVLFCAGSVLGSALMLSLLSKFLVLVVVGAQLWLLLPVLTVLGVTLAVRLHDARTSDLSLPGPYWLATPLLFPLYGLTTVKAAFEYLFTWDGGWYSVEKS